MILSNEALLKEFMARLAKKNDRIYEKIDFCKEHKMMLEATALQYKLAAYSEVRSIIYDLEREILSETQGK